ncbi:MAG: hypothetical protein OXT73_10865 [Bacteroidota bacterium]|nr:hypothetical protein [Bacteroidota bacterium]
MTASLIAFVAALWFAPLPATTPSDCVILADPDYYRIDLVTTRKVSGARLAEGFGEVTYASSPFGVSVSPSGTYLMDIHVKVDKVRLAEDKILAAWVTTPNLDRIVSLGALDENLQVKGQTDFNKFLLVVTLEPADQVIGDMWTGPVVVRGMSRSGLMHTMAGHGPFESEPCAVYGY